jgi:uncharacterized damage-inducible protein DinB
MTLPEPGPDAVDPAAKFLDYLDYFRAEIRRKVADLDDTALHASVLQSGWTPIQLVAHLVHMERRWLVWGFLGEAVDEPWGDHVDGVPSGAWATDRTLDNLLTALDEGGRRTTKIVTNRDLLDHAATGGRFADGQPAPTLMSILFHVMQEYARHMGHLDIVRELIDGTTGEG